MECAARPPDAGRDRMNETIATTNHPLVTREGLLYVGVFAVLTAAAVLQMFTRYQITAGDDVSAAAARR